VNFGARILLRGDSKVNDKALTYGKMRKGGVNEPPEYSTRPEPPKPQRPASAPFQPEPVAEQEVTLEPMEDAKSSMTSLAMYYYRSMVDAGYSSDEAKKAVADFIEEMYLHYCDIGDIEPNSLGTIHIRLQRAISNTVELARVHLPARQIYDDLLSIQAQLKQKR
jgi:hypothetical protein